MDASDEKTEWRGAWNANVTLAPPFQVLNSGRRMDS
jgi:hypothetical protein